MQPLRVLSVWKVGYFTSITTSDLLHYPRFVFRGVTVDRNYSKSRWIPRNLYSSLGHQSSLQSRQQ
jgi:hypothetical protein